MRLFDIIPSDKGPERYRPSIRLVGDPEAPEPDDWNPLAEPTAGDAEPAFALRPYQVEAVERVLEEWQEHQSTPAVCPTGTDKTVNRPIWPLSR